MTTILNENTQEYNIPGRGKIFALSRSEYPDIVFKKHERVSFQGKLWHISGIEVMRKCNGELGDIIGLNVREVKDGI